MKKSIKSKTSDWVMQMLENFEIPKETVLDVPIISLVGNKEIVIENFLSIIEYGEQSIRLKTQCGELYIQGKKLEAKAMDSEHIKINGFITSVEFGSRR